MSWQGFAQIALLLAAVIASVRPLGSYMARVYEGEPILLERALGWLERLIYRLCGVPGDAEKREMRWTTYAGAMLLFNAAGILAVYSIQRTQGLLPLNPQALPAPSPDLSWNTAVSFATNTNWQSYGGETTMSYLTQMLALVRRTRRRRRSIWLRRWAHDPGTFKKCARILGPPASRGA